ncbi:MAG: sensor histidine kinase [Chloroflexales bacterium]
MLRTILPTPDWPAPPLLTPLRIAALWGTVSVVLSVALRRPSHDRLVWLGLATAPAILAFAAALARTIWLLRIPSETLAQLGGALVAAVLSLSTIARAHRAATSWGYRLIQAALDTTLIGVSALLGAAALPPGSLPRTTVALETLTALISDSVLMLTLTLVLLGSPRLAHLMRGYLWLSVICRLCGLGMEQAGAILHWGSDMPLARVSIDTLHWGLLARGVACGSDALSIRQAGHVDPGHRQPDVTTAIPWLAALSGLAVAVVAGRLLAEPLLMLVFAGTLRELGTGLHRRAWHAQLTQAWGDERQELVQARQTTQHQIDGLARLIHDQAAPLNGLWHLHGQLVPASPRDLSARLAAHLDHLQTLAGQLRAALTAPPGPTPLRRCGVDVLPIIGAAIDAAHDRAELGTIELTVFMAAQGTLVLGDPTAIRRILDNLLTNALDATPRCGRVAVELWDDRAYPDFLTITVRDSGRGLREDEHARIFAPEPHPTRGPGLGLGLSIVHDLTTRMGGACGVRSDLGAGSAFWVRLPCSDDATDTRRPTSPSRN